MRPEAGLNDHKMLIYLIDYSAHLANIQAVNLFFSHICPVSERHPLAYLDPVQLLQPPDLLHLLFCHRHILLLPDKTLQKILVIFSF